MDQRNEFKFNDLRAVHLRDAFINALPLHNKPEELKKRFMAYGDIHDGNCHIILLNFLSTIYSEDKNSFKFHVVKQLIPDSSPADIKKFKLKLKEYLDMSLQTKFIQISLRESSDSCVYIEKLWVNSERFWIFYKIVYPFENIIHTDFCNEFKLSSNYDYSQRVKSFKDFIIRIGDRNNNKEYVSKFFQIHLGPDFEMESFINGLNNAIDIFPDLQIVKTGPEGKRKPVPDLNFLSTSYYGSSEKKKLLQKDFSRWDIISQLEMLQKQAHYLLFQLFAEDDYLGFKTVLAGKHWHLIDYFEKIFSPEIMQIAKMRPEVFQTALETRNLEIMEFLVQGIDPHGLTEIFRHQRDAILNRAFLYGHVPSIQFMLKSSGISWDKICKNFNISNVVESGDYALVDALIEAVPNIPKSQEQNPIFKVLYFFVEYAVEQRCDFEILDHLIKKDNEVSRQCLLGLFFNGKILFLATVFDKLDILKYVFRFLPPTGFNKISDYEYHIVRLALVKGHSDLVKLFLKHLPIPVQQELFGCHALSMYPNKNINLFQSSLGEIAAQGRIEILDLFCKEDIKIDDEFLTYAITRAIQNGHLSVVMFLCQRQKSPENSYFKDAFEAGHFDILEYLQKMYPDNTFKLSIQNVDKCIGYAVESNNTEILKIFATKYLSSFKEHLKVKFDSFLETAAKRGFVEMSGLLIELAKENGIKMEESLLSRVETRFDFSARSAQERYKLAAVYNIMEKITLPELALKIMQTGGCHTFFRAPLKGSSSGYATFTPKGIIRDVDKDASTKTTISENDCLIS